MGLLLYTRYEVDVHSTWITIYILRLAQKIRKSGARSAPIFALEYYHIRVVLLRYNACECPAEYS